jgi:hypothetical protein
VQKAKKENDMSKNTNKGNGLAQLETLIGQNIAQASASTPRPAYIGKIEMRYLDLALDKISQPLHANFVRAASASTLQVYRRIQGALAIADASQLNDSKKTAIAVGRAVKDDARTYVTFWLTLLSNVAFAGHMEALAIERSLNPDALESSLDAMGGEHPTEPGDEPNADRARNEHNTRDREIPQPETIACNFDDIYEAMNSIQGWIELAFNQFTPNQLDYWQCVPAPFCKRGADDDYAPITDFDEYREFQTAQWRTKQRVVKADDALAVMEVA